MVYVTNFDLGPNESFTASQILMNILDNETRMFQFANENAGKPLDLWIKIGLNLTTSQYTNFVLNEVMEALDAYIDTKRITKVSIEKYHSDVDKLGIYIGVDDLIKKEEIDETT